MRIVAVDIGGTMIKSGLWNGETFVELRETCLLYTSDAADEL
mgnify:CR=1 FL=1